MIKKVRMQKNISIAMLAAAGLLALTGCAKQGQTENTVSSTDIQATENEAADQNAEKAQETESADNTDRTDSIESADNTETAVTTEPQALAEWQTYEKTLCDADGTELVDITWEQPKLVGNIFPAQEQINAALAEEMEQTLAELEQKEVDEEEMYFGNYLYAMAEAELAWRQEDAESFGTEFHFEPYYYGRSYELARADGEVVSLISTTDTYLGGAHGSRIIAGENYDAQSGERLHLSDIWTDETLFRETCEKEIIALAEKMTEENGEIFFENYRENIQELISDGLWYFSKEGLVFISQEYMLQPYAAGTVIFEIPYEKLTECLR